VKTPCIIAKWTYFLEMARQEICDHRMAILHVINLITIFVPIMLTCPIYRTCFSGKCYGFIEDFLGSSWVSFIVATCLILELRLNYSTLFVLDPNQIGYKEPDLVRSLVIGARIQVAFVYIVQICCKSNMYLHACYISVVIDFWHMLRSRYVSCHPVAPQVAKPPFYQ